MERIKIRTINNVLFCINEKVDFESLFFNNKYNNDFIIQTTINQNDFFNLLSKKDKLFIIDSINEHNNFIDLLNN
jgi:hypothetical protein